MVSIQPGGGKADHMTDQSEGNLGSSARGEAAWKEATEEVADRNRRAQKLGREQREAYERERSDARRAAEALAHKRLLGNPRAPQRREA
jgi:hypothetical protein